MSLNKNALNTATRVLSNQIKLLEAQGYDDLYFNAQFFREGKKQNCIERGQPGTISKQLRNYVRSEGADSMNVEIVDSSTGKVVYRKKIGNLIEAGVSASRNTESNRIDRDSFQGLGAVEINQLVAKQLHDARREDELVRLSKEAEEWRSKYEVLDAEKQELAASLEAKKSLEFYSGIIGAAFPGLLPLFEGTALAKIAGSLSGVSDDSQQSASNQAALPEADEIKTTSAMISEFCDTLNMKESSAMHLLCAAFERDKSKIHQCLHLVMSDDTALAAAV